MIEVNLLPGATRRPAKRRRALKLPSARIGVRGIDRPLLFAIAAWVIGPALVGWMFFSTHHRQAELNLDLQKGIQDSTHYATVIAADQHLRARRDSIASKLELIQDIDGNRYVWAHVLDEVSRALPRYTWLVGLSEVQDTSSALPAVEIDGQTGNTLALTEFMKDLEASPFLRDIRLLSTAIVVRQGKEVHAFSLQAEYETPPASAIQTVPLFKPED